MESVPSIVYFQVIDFATPQLTRQKAPAFWSGAAIC